MNDSLVSDGTTFVGEGLTGSRSAVCGLQLPSLRVEVSLSLLEIECHLLSSMRRRSSPLKIAPIGCCYWNNRRSQPKSEQDNAAHNSVGLKNSRNTQ